MTICSVLPSAVNPSAKYQFDEAALLQAATASPAGWRAICSTNPPPPSISTTADTNAAPGCKAFRSTLCFERASMVIGRSVGAVPAMDEYTVIRPSMGSSSGLVISTDPPTDSSFAGTPGQNHVDVMNEPPGTNGMVGSPSDVNVEVSSTG